jgi:hypothetical protein
VAASALAKQQWWLITHEDGSIEQVCIEGGYFPSECGHIYTGTAQKIDKPGCHLHQKFDKENGVWLDDPEAKALAEHAAKLNSMSNVELVEFLDKRYGKEWK